MSRPEKLIILTIVLLAAALRLFRFWDIPFTHDEFSALFRLEANSFSELIAKGVKTDAHPAAVQVLLFYWTMWFGQAAWVVKLPFALMGIWSVWLTFVIARKWFTSTTAILSAGSLATLQFGVLYSQIARPYISGMFFCLLFVYFWGNVVFNTKQKTTANAIGLIVAGLLCAFNHHFSFLLALVVGFSGYFVIEKTMRLRYTLLGLAIAIGYLPHLSITLFQLTKEGVGAWLSAPTVLFPLQFLDYIFHFSALAMLATFSVIVYGFLNRSKASSVRSKSTLLAAWVLVPLIIGYAYSILINPVLQYSALIFSFPFFLILIFSHFKALSTRQNIALLTVLVVANSLTLIIGRKHYSLAYTSIFEEIVMNHDSIQLSTNKTLSILSSNQLITAYYLDKYNGSQHLYWVDEHSKLNEFAEFLGRVEKEHDQLYLGSISAFDDRYIGIIKQFFPKITWRKDFAQGSVYLFSKDEADSDQFTFSATEQAAQWSGVRSKQFLDTGQFAGTYVLPGNDQWSPRFNMPLFELASMENDLILVTVSGFSATAIGDIDIIANIKSGSEIKEWRTTPIALFQHPDTTFVTAHHVLDLSIVNDQKSAYTVNASLWNKSDTPFYIESITVEKLDGNPYLYWVVEPIHKPRKVRRE